MPYEISSQNCALRWQGSQRRIGLTGGIASGKSSVGAYLAQKGLPVLDADEFSRSALTSNALLTSEVVAHFGTAIQNPDTSINRRLLGKLVFRDLSARRWLEQRVHPVVLEQFESNLGRLPLKATVVLMIPLLFEAGMEGLCSEIWLVSCKSEQQLERLIRRDKLTHKEAQARIDSQWPILSKHCLADAVISNIDTPGCWQDQTDHLLNLS